MCTRNDKEEKFSLLRIIIYKLKWYEMIEYHVLSILDLVEKRKLQLWKKKISFFSRTYLSIHACMCTRNDKEEKFSLLRIIIYKLKWYEMIEYHVLSILDLVEKRKLQLWKKKISFFSRTYLSIHACMCTRNDKEEKFSLLRIIIYKLKWYEMIEYHVLSILDLVEKRKLQLWKKKISFFSRTYLSIHACMCTRNDKEEKFSLLRIIIYKLKWYEMIEYHVLSILDLVEKRKLQLWKKKISFFSRTYLSIHACMCARNDKREKFSLLRIIIYKLKWHEMIEYHVLSILDLVAKRELQQRRKKFRKKRFRCFQGHTYLQMHVCVQGTIKKTSFLS